MVRVSGLNYFNSWALHDSPVHVPGLVKGGFNFPFFYTMFHMLATSLWAILLMCTCAKPKEGGLPGLRQMWEYKYQVFPIATLTVLNNGLNNMSLTMVALFVNQVIKGCQPLPTSGFEYIFAGKTYSWKIYPAISMIVVGAILSNSDSFKSGGNTSVMGIIACVISKPQSISN